MLEVAVVTEVLPNPNPDFVVENPKLGLGICDEVVEAKLNPED